MEQQQRFREVIRQIIKQELEEATTTGSVAGYLTPYAFRGNKQKQIARAKHIATDTTGFKLTPRGEKEINSPADKMETVKQELSENRYYKYKNDPTATPHQKIAKAISELNKSLHEVERIEN